MYKIPPTMSMPCHGGAAWHDLKSYAGNCVANGQTGQEVPELGLGTGLTSQSNTKQVC
jgi:hypothetical protein